MAERILRGPGDDGARLDRAYEIAYGRTPLAKERTVLLAALSRYRQRYAADEKGAEKLLTIGDAPRSKAIPAPEHAAWMLLCSTLMNTDEFLTLH